MENRTPRFVYAYVDPPLPLLLPIHPLLQTLNKSGKGNGKHTDSPLIHIRLVLSLCPPRGNAEVMPA